MSGTSCDGIDVACVELEECEETASARMISVQGFTVPFKNPVAAALRGLLATPGSFADAARADVELGELFADAAERGLAAWGRVDGIALSGHTFSHLPAETPACTLQLGSPAIVAERTGTPVLFGFRAADVARGGEGAPLVPAGDRVLFGELADPIAVVNIGGISNVTWLERGRDPAAVDSGPGNLLLDRLHHDAHPEGPGFDRDGALAMQGEVDHDWLAAHRRSRQPSSLLKKSFRSKELFQQTAREEVVARRSFGREEFGEGWWRAQHVSLAEFSTPDRLATICAWVAEELSESMRILARGRSPERLLVGGGGARNRRLVAELTARAGLEAEPLDAELHGVGCDLREAAAFAILGHEWVYGRPGSFLETTGAPALPRLGSWAFPGKGAHR